MLVIRSESDQRNYIRDSGTNGLLWGTFFFFFLEKSTNLDDYSACARLGECAFEGVPDRCW